MAATRKTTKSKPPEKEVDDYFVITIPALILRSVVFAAARDQMTTKCLSGVLIEVDTAGKVWLVATNGRELAAANYSGTHYWMSAQPPKRAPMKVFIDLKVANTLAKLGGKRKSILLDTRAKKLTELQSGPQTKKELKTFVYDSDPLQGGRVYAPWREVLDGLKKFNRLEGSSLVWFRQELVDAIKWMDGILSGGDPAAITPVIAGCLLQSPEDNHVRSVLHCMAYSDLGHSFEWVHVRSVGGKDMVDAYRRDLEKFLTQGVGG